jgi:serine/threonine-protein kinase 24/25/MST4
MAKGSPPLADLHPMRVLFIIPKSPPPELGEGFSETFRHFVATCLAKDPGQRPTARDLLSHPFLAAASEPPGFAGMVTEYARRKKPLPPTSTSGDEQYGTQGAGSGPAWDFGTRRASRGTVGAGSTGTVKISDTLKAGMVDRYAQVGVG